MPDAVVAQLDVPADLVELRGLGPWLADVLAQAGASSFLGGLELALHEVCVNVVTHAYHGGEGRIQVRCRCDPELIELEVRDTSGTVFDAGDVSEPVAGLPQIHGYGLMIVRQLVDELIHTRQEEVNVWLLRTRR